MNETSPSSMTMTPLLRAFLWLSITVITFYILHIGKDLIIPLVLAVFIWYLINVLSFAIMKLNIRGRTLPASLRYIASFLVIAACLGFLFNFITHNISDVRAVAPEYQAKIQPLIDNTYEKLGIEQPPGFKEFVAQFDYSGTIGKLASALTSIASNAGIISIYVMFLFLEQRSFGPKLRAMSEGTIKNQEVSKIVRHIDKDIRLYIGIKTLSSATTGLLSYALMAAIGLDFAAFWGMLIFFLNFIPTVGSILATVFPSLLAVIVFESPAAIIGVVGGITGIQILVGNFMEPKLMGNSLNLSPLVILLSLGLWGSLWGITGMFLCVPITVIAMIICSHFQQTRPVAILLSGNGKLKTLD